MVPVAAVIPVANEQPFFFQGAQAELFGVYHEPAAEAVARVPFVFSHPFAEEKLWAHRVFVAFARRLARHGHPVLRFDYTGNGDSGGAFAEATLDGAAADLEAAIDTVQARGGARTVSLLGLRLGASVAARVAARRGDVERLVLWSPIVFGAPYLQELLRINLSTQLAVYREVREDREALAAQLAMGRTVNVDGYPLGRAMADQLAALDLATEPACQKPTLVVQIDRKPAAAIANELQKLTLHCGAATTVVAQEEPFWKEIARFYENAANLFAATEQWLGLAEAQPA